MRHFNFSNDNYIEFKGSKSFLIGADIHYFRIDPEHWRDRIQKAIDMGCNAISIYIPWAAHEVEDNSFDFDGTTHPRRNLIAFLELAKEFDIAMIAKPGPYVYSELPAQGLPEWFVNAYPECWAQTWDGKNFVPMVEENCHAVSYLHPVYQKFAQRWLSKVLSTIKPYQRSQNGTIEAVQICNEISGVHVWLAGYDSHPDSMQFGKEDGLYAEFFKAKYKTIEAVNNAHNAKYKTFADVAVPLMGKHADSEKNRNLANDYAEFYYNSYIPKYVDWLIKQFKYYGITEQLITNIAFPEMVV
ncbi:MAG: beta-galactosidase, partial [Armatimonadota bacterium]